MMPELPDAPRKFPNAPTASQKLPDAPKGSQKIPQAPKRSQNAPRSFQRLLEKSKRLPETPGNSPKSPETASHGVDNLIRPGEALLRLLVSLVTKMTAKQPASKFCMVSIAVDADNAAGTCYCYCCANLSNAR